MGRENVIALHYMQGKFIPSNPSKYRGDLKDIVFRSGWERTAFVMCDQTPQIIEWSSETVIIPYVSPVDGRQHRYFTDLWLKVRQHDGSIKQFIIEIKPKSQTKPPRKTKSKKEQTYLNEVRTYAVNKAKWEAARKFCKQKGWEFKIWTEDVLLPK